ncbi:Uu.00g107070.m01.CDS01 [Anthostomella pinea]|uniref:Uu.00g107070.m01.CDS01 n=1 Tax=Anthostomella pinea TaxID=933095 RepID=A0AAI8YFV3_9PEZI|nr:Uu.00g107070.m01.CDS01 [Anthostomella pinea]
MASIGMVEAGPQTTNHTLLPATATSHPLVAKPADDDESDWEYEYSTTETETFYVTLDLSKSDFKAPDTSKIHCGRGEWEGAKNAEPFLNKRKSADQSASNSAASSAVNSDAEQDDDDEQQGEARLGKGTQSSGPEVSAEKGEDAHKVQILDLHTTNPIVSYKGRVYAGQWSENVTTELLMTRHDDNEPFPVLRHLDNDVDLLAASCARVTVREQQLKPKDDLRGHQGGFDDDNIPSRDIVPVPDKGANKERLGQGVFLANLMALKKRKGETDEVTLLAKHADKRTARTKVGSYRRTGGRRGRRGRPRVAGRGRTRGAPLHLLREASLGAESAASSGAPSQVASESVSTPTPSQWSELADDDEENNAPRPLHDLMEEDEDGVEDEDVLGSGSEDHMSEDDQGEDREDIAEMDIDED